LFESGRRGDVNKLRIWLYRWGGRKRERKTTNLSRLAGFAIFSLRHSPENCFGDEENPTI